MSVKPKLGDFFAHLDSSLFVVVSIRNVVGYLFLHVLAEIVALSLGVDLQLFFLLALELTSPALIKRLLSSLFKPSPLLSVPLFSLCALRHGSVVVREVRVELGRVWLVVVWVGLHCG